MTYKIDGKIITEKLIKHVAKGGFIVFLGSIIGRILAFTFHIVLARGLGIISYGLYILGQNVFDIIVSITSLGNGSTVIRFGAINLNQEDRPKLKGLLINSAFISLTLSIIFAIILFISSRAISIYLFKKEDLTNVIRLFSLGLPFYTLIIIMTAISIAFHNMKYRVLLQGFTQPLANLILVLIAFSLGWHLYGAIWGFILANLICIVIGWNFIKKLLPEMKQIKPIYDIKNNILYSIPIIFGTLIYFVLLNLDSLMLGIFSTTANVAIYNVVLKSTLPIFIFSGFFITPLYPVISELIHNKELNVLSKVYNITAEWGGWINFIPFFIIIIFGREILMLFGEQYLAGVDILYVLGLAFFIDSLPGNLKQVLEMGGAQKLELINSCLAFILNLMLIFMLIRPLGMIGVAIAHLLAVIIMILIRMIQVKKLFKILPFNWRYLKFIGFSLLVFSVIALWARNLDLMARFVLSCLIFISYIFIIYSIKAENEQLIWDAMKLKFSRFKLLGKKI